MGFRTIALETRTAVGKLGQRDWFHRPALRAFTLKSQPGTATGLRHAHWSVSCTRKPTRMQSEKQQI